MDVNICRERILSEDYYDFIVSDSRTPFLSSIAEEQLCTQTADFGYTCVYLPKLQAAPITFEKFSYNAIPKCYAPMSLDALQQTGILPIQNYPTLQLTGSGVMIGIVDSGIDYENEIFRNLDGSTRIAGLWDQTDQSGSMPDLFAYGSTYTEEDLNAALRSADPGNLVPQRDENGHGTFVASLAAGGGVPAEEFLGAAPEAVLGIVKLKPAKSYLKDYYFIPEDQICYEETDIVLGLRYLSELARERDLPLVLCVPLGTSSGGHLGALPLSLVLTGYGSVGNRIPVTGTGNEADKRHHFLNAFSGVGEERTVEIRVGDGTAGFTAELWTSLPNILSISLESPSGESTSWLSIRGQASTDFSFLLERTRVSIDYRLVVEKTSSELVFFRFLSPVPGIWRLHVRAERILNGKFHVWLPLSEFLSGETFFLNSDPDYTITNPGNAAGALTTSYYDGSQGSLALSSGRGYTRIGAVKPDFAAPGINVTGVLPGNRFVSRSGSSISTAITAGAAALLLEWIIYQLGTPAIDAYQLKSLFILGAVRPSSMQFPNQEWGYGQLNLYNMFEEFRRF